MDGLLYAEYTKAGHAVYKAMFFGAWLWINKTSFRSRSCLGACLVRHYGAW